MAICTYIGRRTKGKMRADMNNRQIFQAERQKVNLRIGSMRWKRRKSENKTKTQNNALNSLS